MVTKEEIRKKYDEAPPDVQALVNDPEVYDAFHLIRRTHNLHLDAAGALADLINALILGIVPLTELDNHLSLVLPGVDAAQRDKIKADLDAHIFKPLRERKRAETPDLGAQYKSALVAKLSLTVPLEDERAPSSEERATPVRNTSSIVAQKLGASPSAPVPEPAVRPEEKGITTPRTGYRGVDPYREPVE